MAHFTRTGYLVSIPLMPTTYDLVIEKDGTFSRVQCKYTGRLCYRYRVKMRRTTRSGQRPIDADGFDLLYVLAFDGTRFIVPATDLSQLHGDLLLLDRWRIEDQTEPTTPPFTPGRCRRCYKPYQGPRKCCDACREATSETQRQYRARRRIRP